MKLKFVLIGLLFIFGQFLSGQTPELGSYGYRLIKTVKDADFDYKRLDAYFKDPVLLDGLEKSGASIFEPIEGSFTIHFFLADIITEQLLLPEGGSTVAFVPAENSQQMLLILKVMESFKIVDGFVLPLENTVLPLSVSLFRVRTKELAMRKDLSIKMLNCRNLYDKELRVAEGKVFVDPTLYSKYDKITEYKDTKYKLVKKVLDADFDYSKLENVEKAIVASFEETQKKHDHDGFWSNTEILDRGKVAVFEPVSGNYIYYQFIADVVGTKQMYAGYLEERDSFADTMDIFYPEEEFFGPLIMNQRLLILKTNNSGIILDGYQFALSSKHRPFNRSLYRLSQHGLRLRDGMKLKELLLKSEKDEYYGYSPKEDMGTIFLMPKLD